MRSRFLTLSMANYSMLRARNQTERRIVALEGDGQPITTWNQDGGKDGLARDPMEHLLKDCLMGLSEWQLYKININFVLLWNVKMHLTGWIQRNDSAFGRRTESPITIVLSKSSSRWPLIRMSRSGNCKTRKTDLSNGVVGFPTSASELIIANQPKP